MGEQAHHSRLFLAFFLVFSALLILYLSIQARMDTGTFSQPAYMPVLLQTENQSVRRVRFRPRLSTADKIQIGINLKQEKALRKRPMISREGPEIHQVIFAKVHKAASSTMQNIFLRFALARNLSVLLPKTRTSLSEHSKYFSREDVIPQAQGKKFYDILCSHVIFDEHQLSQYFPDSAVRVAIVREPLQQALSALKYYLTTYPTRSLMKGFNQHKEDPINGYIRYPQHFSTIPTKSHVNNRMSIDLGFNPDDFEASKRDNAKIQAFLQQVERQFDVVLVSEYFDESLIFMRRILRWSIKDIIYLKVNVAKSKPIVNKVLQKQPTMNSTIYQRFQQWNKIDFKLYDHFLNIFLKTIQSEPDFREELKAFRLIQMDIKYFCLHDVTAKTLRVLKSRWTYSFVLFREDCRLMSMNEQRFTNKVRREQIKRYESYTGKHFSINDSWIERTRSNFRI